MSNEKLAGDLVEVLLDIYKAQMAEMKATGEINVGLLKEVREFMKMHGIELDANAAPMQELSEDLDELREWRERKAAK